MSALNDDVQASLDSMQHDVLERWRNALADHDTERVGELVQFAHALRDVGYHLRPEVGGDDVSGVSNG